jgi:tRNA pseudouridine(38-40) synthase
LDKGKHKSLINFGKIRAFMNASLPPNIRVFQIVKASKGFNAKKAASFRIYEYLAPVFLFQKEALKPGQGKYRETVDAGLARLQTLVKTFKGTHNFHNYTRQHKAQDPQAQRYIIDVKVQLVEKAGKEHYLFLITGQSFLYHQIRKMIGILIQIFQEDKTNKFIEHSMM